jgi:hypothetical protein
MSDEGAVSVVDAEGARALPTDIVVYAALFDRCGDHVFVAGPMRLEPGAAEPPSGQPRPGRVERVDLATGEVTTLFESTELGGGDYEPLELDERGWLLVSRAEPNYSSRAWVWLIPADAATTADAAAATAFFTLQGDVYGMHLGRSRP